MKGYYMKGVFDMPKFIDKTGMVFGQLTVLSRAENKGKYVYWNCKCSCGKEVCVRGDKLTLSHVDEKGNPSCGCLRIPHMVNSVKKDLKGQRFSKLTVLEETDRRNSSGSVIWKCQCDCGNITYVSQDCLCRKNNPTKSCGCLQKEVASNHLKELKLNLMPKINTYEKDFLVLDTELKPTNNGHNESWVYVKCPFCDNKKWIQLRYIRNGDTKSCGCISSSAGEEKIVKLLNQNKILFEKEKIFSDLKNINPLRFDFYIINENYLIEFDGLQHYEVQKFGNISEEEALQKFKELQKRDKIKNEYCLKNQIPLIRIPYWKYDSLELNDLLLETSSFIIEEDE